GGRRSRRPRRARWPTRCGTWCWARCSWSRCCWCCGGSRTWRSRPGSSAGTAVTRGEGHGADTSARARSRPRHEEVLAARRAEAVFAVGEVPVADGPAGEVFRTCEAGLACHTEHVVGGVEAGERRAGGFGAGAAGFEPGLVVLVEHLHRQQE